MCKATGPGLIKVTGAESAEDLLGGACILQLAAPAAGMQCWEEGQGEAPASVAGGGVRREWRGLIPPTFPSFLPFLRGMPAVGDIEYSLPDPLGNYLKGVGPSKVETSHVQTHMGSPGGSCCWPWQ